MTAIEIIRLVGPEFSTTTDVTLQKWIEVVTPMVSKQRFGKFYEQAIAYLACHKLKMSGGGSSDVIPAITDTVRISSMSEGETSVSFGGSQQTNLGTDAEFALTVYGMQYLTLRRAVVVPITCSGERSVK